jgi:hypothetical protein
MRERVHRQTQTLKGIARFLRKTDFPNARAQHLKEELLVHHDRVIELTEENHKAKFHADSGRRRPRFTKNRFREQQLLPLSRRGRKLGRDYAELLPALKVPHKNAPVAEIADAAERMAEALTPHLNVLIKAKYPRNCLETLRQDARALREQADTVQESRDLLGRSNRELTRELAVARDTINELDLVLRSLKNYREDYRNGWETCNRVGARMGRPSKRRLAARERSKAKSKAREDRASTA